jgi:hypothetical protein
MPIEKPNRSFTMYALMHEELARARMRERREEAHALSRAHRLVAARRWQRRAEQSARRARAAREAVA